jgi:hypothetical protein
MPGRAGHDRLTRLRLECAVVVSPMSAFFVWQVVCLHIYKKKKGSPLSSINAALTLIIHFLWCGTGRHADDRKRRSPTPRLTKSHARMRRFGWGGLWSLLLLFKNMQMYA